MNIYGLIGTPLAHSQSPDIFRQIFLRESIRNAEYRLFPLQDIQGIRALVRSNDVQGFSVTIPHKQAIIPYLDEVDTGAAKIGAVNAVKVIREKGRLFLKGYNTDAPAFLDTLRDMEVPRDTRALVLGTGGAARAVRHALETLHIEYTIVTRSRRKPGYICYSDLNADIFQTHLLVINTTPVGMFPDINAAPSLPYMLFTPGHIAYDLVYNPPETLFLKKAREEGALGITGMRMLQKQAELAWKIWNTAG
jgi:shikimate dehydrogenase